MIVKFYREGLAGVIAEVLELVQHPDPDARHAGLDFAQALKTMVSKQVMFVATPLKPGVWSTQVAPGSLWARQQKAHSLYLSHIKVPPAAGGPEVRALLAADGVPHTPQNVQEAVVRHHKVGRQVQSIARPSSVSSGPGAVPGSV